MGNQNSRTYIQHSVHGVEVPSSVVYKGPLGTCSLPEFSEGNPRVVNTASTNVGEHGRFFKTSLCMHDQGGPVTVKSYRVAPDDDVSVYEDALLSVESRLSQDRHVVSSRNETMEQEDRTSIDEEISSPTHVWSNQEIIHDTGMNAVHIVRQYFWSSLSQRMTNRPFLTWSEKAWIGYQIVMGLVEAHEHGVCHGDVKTENVMLTSWGWVFLVDFLPFKPTWLPKDNPADFSIFFDTSGKRKCCIAPERFVLARDGVGGGLKAEMDMFSLGCVLAEVFSDGVSIFKYSDVLEYARNGKYPDGFLQGIDARVVGLIEKLLSRDPGKRPCAKECVTLYVACEGMHGHDFERLHTICHDWWNISLDDRISRAVSSFPCGDDDILRHQYPVERSRRLPWNGMCDGNHREKEHYVSLSDIDSVGKNLIQKTKDILEHGLEHCDGVRNVEEEIHVPSGIEDHMSADDIVQPGRMQLDASEHQLLFHNLTVIYCSLLRSCRHFSSKMRLLYQIQYCAHETRHTEIILHVVIPNVVTAATDVNGRSRTKTYALSLIPKLISLLDSTNGGHEAPASAYHVVGDYILPSISLLPHDGDLAVQCEYACSIGTIGMTSMNIIYYQGSNNPESRDEYLKRMRGIIERGVHDILVGASSLPKLALLPHLREITYGIGCQGSIHDLLPALLTLFNSREWNVRAALYSALEDIFPVLGTKALPFILPFSDRLLTDPEIGSLLSGITFLTRLVYSRLLSINEVVQINKKVLDVDTEHLQMRVVQGHIRELYRVSRAFMGKVSSNALLFPIYDSDTWKAACKRHKNAQQKMSTLHIAPNIPFHAEYASDTLETYSISLNTSEVKVNEMFSLSALERIIDSSAGGDQESRKNGCGVLLQSPSLRKGFQSMHGREKRGEISKYRLPKDWEPKGILVARIPCHSKPITQISENLFKGSTLFATSSKDGTCKLWDTRKIEKDISFHPRTTFVGTSGYNGVCAASADISPPTLIAGRVDGYVDAWDIQSNAGPSSSWTCGPGSILDVKYFKHRNLSIVSTAAHKIIGIDTRATTHSWTLLADPSHGIPIRIGIDHTCPHYFVTGTSRGSISVWDMRFLIPVNTWRHPAHAPIESIALASGEQIGVPSTSPVAIIASGTDEISGWDIASGSCKIVLASRPARAESTFVPETLKVSVMNSQKPVEDPLGLARQMGASDLRAISTRRTSVKTVLVTETGKILTGGVDKCIWLWNPKVPCKSSLVAGARTADSTRVSPEFSQTYHGTTKVILVDHEKKSASPESTCVWHSGTISSLMQVQGQKEPLVASACTDGILHVWR